MDQFFKIISIRHQNKLRILAKSKGVTPQVAIRNLITYLQGDNENLGRPNLMECITAKKIEELIDTIS